MTYKNTEGYADPTAGAAIIQAEPKPKKKEYNPKVTAIPEYRPVYDRYKRMSHFEHRPLYEWGYIEFEYLPSNNH